MAVILILFALPSALPVPAAGYSTVLSIPLFIIAFAIGALGVIAFIVFIERAQRRIIVQSNVRGRDLGSFVAEAQRRVRTEVNLPTGYFIRWGGQFEHRERAMSRLTLVTPVLSALRSLSKSPRCVAQET